MIDIPGLGCPVTQDTLMASRQLYNALPPDAPFPEIDEQSDVFREACEMIANSNAYATLQGHVLVSIDQRRLGDQDLGDPALDSDAKVDQDYVGTCTVTQPELFADLDLSNIHGLIFSVAPSHTRYPCEGKTKSPRLLPSEFRYGLPGNVENVDASFFTAFSNFVVERGLANVLGIKVMQGQAESLVEFSFDDGSLLVEKKDVSTKKVDGRLSNTGWAVTESGAVNQRGEVRCIASETEHFRVTANQAKGVLDVLKVLVDQGILGKKYLNPRLL
ncbi:hypothetical protein C8A00DRAFT_46866 [Chaetomidium leptoderma]|uniref:Uncharacterized protein n=1 Tax=Chaetomidium leptoderma TaxID=669021 RepID=A0AAN6VFF8_9PEZI|nr:hypothetical protein C8A00DRAFT_46866 [Chaetomidium leptoderma]